MHDWKCLPQCLTWSCHRIRTPVDFWDHTLLVFHSLCLPPHRPPLPDLRSCNSSSLGPPPFFSLCVSIKRALVIGHGLRTSKCKSLHRLYLFSSEYIYPMITVKKKEKFPELVNMLPYYDKKAFTFLIKLRILRRGDYSGLPGMPVVILIPDMRKASVSNQR